MDFVAIDFETANGSRNSACAIGLVIVEGGKIVERRSDLIRPVDDHFSWRNTSLHGISLIDVLDCPTFDELWPEIQDLIAERPLVAHFAAFDMSVLRATLSHYDIPFPRSRYACTLAISKRLWPQLHCHKLNVVAQHLKIELNHHDAASDAEVCARIALKACQDSGGRSLSDMASLYGIRYRRLV